MMFENIAENEWARNKSKYYCIISKVLEFIIVIDNKLNLIMTLSVLSLILRNALSISSKRTYELILKYQNNPDKSVTIFVPG